jgi:hypothetical protein
VTDRTDGGLRIKYASVTLDARGRVTDAKGPPRVSAERADGSRTVRGGTGGFATAPDGVSWWPTVVTFGGSGCWTVTETLGPTTVRFTVNVTGG